MSFTTSQPTDEQRSVATSRQNIAERDSNAVFEAGSQGSSAIGATLSRQLFGDSKLMGRSNGTPRAATFHSIQQTYGNRAVQRVVQRQALDAGDFEDPEVKQKVQAINDSEANPPGYGNAACDADPLGYGGPCDPPHLPKELEPQFKMFHEWADMVEPPQKKSGVDPVLGY